MNNKFNINDIIKNTSDENKSGCVKGIIERCYGNRNSYLYLVSNGKKHFLESEETIKLLKRASEEDYVHESKYTRELEIGDVVAFNSGLPIGEYVISSDVKSENYSELYKVIPIGNNPYNESCICEKSMLKFIYHDSRWAEIIMESVRNTLPAWKGELYNFSHLKNSEIKLARSKPADVTLPIKSMEHIIDKHSIRERIGVILRNKEFKSSIAKEMHCPIEEINKLEETILTKIDVLNGLGGIETIDKDRHGHRKMDFTDKESKLISLVGYYDKYKRIEDSDDNSGESKDHYPPYMSDYDIMKAIKEAYGNAEKVEKRKHGKKPLLEEGKTLFQGKSKDGLNIQFYFQYDGNYITTAYPVFVDTTNRPDLRHPTNKNKKRQN